MRALSLLVIAVVGLVALPALAQTPPAAPPVRIRGTIDKLDGHTLTIKSRDGTTVTVTLADNVQVAYLVKKTLADIKTGDYVSVTYKGTTSDYIIDADTPIFAYAQGDTALLVPGAAVFIVAPKKDDGSITAARVTVEKDGVKPPM